jgi:SAM-dependent methyltransferase
VSKRAEIEYFEAMTEEARRFAAEKPFSAGDRGAYLLDLGQILCLLPPPPGRLLDLGCGSGWTTSFFARSGYDAVGLDLAPAAIELARETFGSTGARFEAGDFERLSHEGTFDLCVIYDCLHHAEHPERVIDGVFRALRPGGEVVVMEPGRGHHRSATSQWAIREHGTTENDMPPSKSGAMLRAAGFEGVRIVPRARFQISEREPTGGLARLLRPAVGPRAASLAKNLKNSLCPARNGVVQAMKRA